MLITDTTPLHIIDAGGGAKGRLDGPPPVCYSAVAEPCNDALLVPESEWQARIQERQARKTGLRDIIRRSGLKVLDQQRTNYCWVNAPTFAAMAMRAVQNQPLVLLSPASVGAPIKEYANRGGWGSEAIRYAQEHGWVPQSMWPANAIDRQYDTVEARTERAYYRVLEWQLLREAYGPVQVAGDLALRRLVSYLLRNVPVPVGYPWWSHEVCAVDVGWKDGQPTIIFANSWGEAWGDEGYGELQGDRRVPADAVAPQVMRAA